MFANAGLFVSAGVSSSSDGVQSERRSLQQHREPVSEQRNGFITQERQSTRRSQQAV